MSNWNEMKHEPAARTNVLNPIRVILERDMKPPQDHPLPMINLGLGEPSKAHGYTLPTQINEAMIAAVNSETANGYTMATGTIPAREAVAKKFSTPEFPINPNHVIMSFGCSGALYNAIAALCETGTRLLVASPGFPLCQPICQNLGVNFDTYNLKPDEKEGWIIDLQDLESKITKDTRAILVNNPSNPCGSCFSKQHLLDVIAIADKHKVPIIADEVYHGLSYEEERPFVSMGHLTKDVPILATGSISKIYLLPGWRCGWVIVYNNHGYFDKVLDNLGKHAMIQLHPTSLV